MGVEPVNTQEPGGYPAYVGYPDLKTPEPTYTGHATVPGEIFKRQTYGMSDVAIGVAAVLSFCASKSLDEINPSLGVVFRITSFALAIKPIIASYQYFKNANNHQDSNNRPNPFLGEPSERRKRTSTFNLSSNSNEVSPQTYYQGPPTTVTYPRYQVDTHNTDGRLNRLDENGSSNHIFESKEA